MVLNRGKNNILSLFAKAILTFVGCFHFPRCGYVMFLFKNFLSFIICNPVCNRIKTSYGLRISFTLKFMMQGLLIFKIFYDGNICSGYIPERFKFVF